MSKRRVQNTERPPSRSGKSTSLESFRFAGVSLSGGKNAKTHIAVLDYFPTLDRLVLSHFIDTIKPEDEISGDDILLESLRGLGDKLKTVAVDVPLTLPKCVTCQLKCPGIAKCKEPHIAWHWEHFRKERAKKKKNTKLFTPYTQRPVEAYISSLREEDFHPADALGANTAPLTARMQFLLKRLNWMDVIEAFPRITIWRLGSHLKILKRHLRFHKHSVEGDKSRLHVLSKLAEAYPIFIYQQDSARIVENGHAFDAFVCALTAYLKFKGETEARPEGFPKEEAWIEIPV